MKEEKIVKTLSLSDTCSRCENETYVWVIENNDKVDYVAFCLDHLLDFAKHTEKYERKRN